MCVILSDWKFTIPSSSKLNSTVVGLSSTLLERPRNKEANPQASLRQTLRYHVHPPMVKRGEQAHSSSRSVALSLEKLLMMSVWDPDMVSTAASSLDSDKFCFATCFIVMVDLTVKLPLRTHDNASSSLLDTQNIKMSALLVHQGMKFPSWKTVCSPVLSRISIPMEMPLWRPESMRLPRDT